MENQPESLQNQPVIHETSQEQPSVLQDTLLDAADMTGYDKNLKRARIWLYVISGLQVAFGVFEYFRYDSLPDITRWLAFGIDATVGLLFLACALWSFKKPAPAFLTALISYIVVNVGSVLLSPENIASGIIIKIFIVIALVRAYKDAKHIEEMKSLLSQ